MYFSNYLKSCRERNGLTQEQLVHALYSFDTKYFQGLDTSTFSKWERGITKPSTAKQTSVLRYFQQHTGKALPCWEHLTADEAEAQICETGMKNMLGSKSKELVMRFPEKMTAAGDLVVKQLRNTEILDEVAQFNVDLDQGFNQRFTGLDNEDFKAWALHPSNTFFVSTYKGHFFGLLFALRLKPEIFEKVMSLEIKEKDISFDDFATFDEPGCSYIISFFALNEKSASLLFIRYFAHLIANQDVTIEVGFATMIEDAIKLTRNMSFKHYKSIIIEEERELQTYRQTLPEFLASEYMVRMLLSHRECPEE